MTDFGDLTRDLGIRQQGKSAPMSASKPSSSSSMGSGSANPVAVNDIISGYKDPNPNQNPQLNSMPAYDRPVYDDDDVFGSTSRREHVEVDDLFGGSGSKRSGDLGGFEELIAGFGGSNLPNQREPEINQQKSAVPYEKSSADMSEDPFVVFELTSSSAHSSKGMSTNPLEDLGRSMNPGSSNANASSVNGGIFDDNGAFDGFAKSVPLFTSEKNESMKGKSPLESGPSRSDERSSRESFDNAIPRTWRSSRESFDNAIPQTRPTKSFDSRSSVQSPTSSDSPYKRNVTEDQSPRSSEYLERADDAWLTVTEIPLFTEPTRGPPPSRRPPPLSMKSKPYGRADLRRKGKENESYSPSTSNNLYPKGSESSELERDEETTPHAQDLGGREQREREERDREQKILEKGREVERENAARAKAERAAVEKANAEARRRADRAATEAREKANAEARRRADRAAAQRAAAEARERAFAEAQEKAARERANAEAREKAAAEARLRAERERAAAAAAREKQYKAENDLEAFFGMSSRPSSAPKQRATTSENFFDSQAQSRSSANGAWRTSSASSAIRKTSSTTNIVDDLTSIFGGASSSGEFQEVEGESEDRRRARFERHQRTQERTMKALAEKNERDMQSQMEQAEKHRIAETLDGEIKLWARGKENNLRALLSSLEYILWPECGWQPVPLTDLVTAAAVKKVYRKATLCIHPDKVQQKGANLQQKCIAEKVFDILKEAWNKFNSEELF